MFFLVEGVTDTSEFEGKTVAALETGTAVVIVVTLQVVRMTLHIGRVVLLALVVMSMGAPLVEGAALVEGLSELEGETIETGTGTAVVTVLLTNERVALLNGAAALVMLMGAPLVEGAALVEGVSELEGGTVETGTAADERGAAVVLGNTDNMTL